MKRDTSELTLLSSALGLIACATFAMGAHCQRIVPPTPGPDAGVDAGPAPQVDAGPDAALSACERGCAQLARLGCPEGDFTGCAQLADQINAERMTMLPCACWATARTAAEARACGGLICPGGSP